MSETDTVSLCRAVELSSCWSLPAGACIRPVLYPHCIPRTPYCGMPARLLAGWLNAVICMAKLAGMSAVPGRVEWTQLVFRRIWGNEAPYDPGWASTDQIRRCCVGPF